MKYASMFLVSLGLILSCDNKSLDNVVESSLESFVSEIDTTKIKYGKPFFNYDEIDYYHIDVHYPKFKGNFSFQDSILSRALFNSIILDSNRFMPISENDTILEEKNFKYYSELGFKKYNIKHEDFTQINQVFCSKSIGVSDMSMSSCAPVFRDHLVFKKRNRIIGHAFICLGCNVIFINGKIENKRDIGYEIDIIRLTRVLSKYDKNAAKHY